MLRNHFLLAFGAAGLLSMGAVACGDDADGNTGGSAPAGRQPPARPSGAAAGDGAGKIFGTSKIYIGTKTRAGVEDSKAWADYGYDLDGLVTSQDFTGHCKPAGGGAPKSVFPDGNDGIDNSFGKYLLPIIKTAAGSLGGGDLEAELNSALTEGSFTIMLDLRNLGAGSDYDPINALLYAGKDGMGSTWNVAPEFLDAPPSLDSAKVKFPNSYVTGNTWVSGDKGTVALNIAIGGASFALNIRSAVITMDISGDNASGGVISGVLDTEELVNQIRDIVGPLISCDGAGVDGILNQIRQGSDIMKDGSQNGDAECNGISIGLGFDAAPVTIAGVGTPAEPGENPCEGGGGVGGGSN